MGQRTLARRGGGNIVPLGGERQNKGKGRIRIEMLPQKNYSGECRIVSGKAEVSALRLETRQGSHLVKTVPGGAVAFCLAAPSSSSSCSSSSSSSSSSCPQLPPGAGWHAAVATLEEEELYFPSTKQLNEASTFFSFSSVKTSPKKRFEASLQGGKLKEERDAEVRRSIVECASAPPVLSSDRKNVYLRLILKYTRLLLN